MPRVWFWLQLIIGWLPFWALYTTLIMTAHDATPERAAWIALRAITGAALLGLPIPRLTRRLPWPQTFSFAFLAWHLLAASVYAASWLLLSSLFETGLHRSLTLLPARPLIPFLVVGVWLYVMVAGVSYAAQATDRAVQAEANAARAGLAALRSQLHPHFLFNAMHTVVQLIPREPARASEAAELIAGVLRTTLEERRDLIPLSDEVAFVRRYVQIEHMRFADRLRIAFEIAPEAGAVLVPSFALQTLVENAVRHAAAPRIEPTTVHVAATLADQSLTLTVADDGHGAADDVLTVTDGTGLARLRERLAVLYGARARMQVEPSAPGFRVVLTLPDDD
ncbi:MAG: histidine kinase [Gemmatimonadaceae bacterium]|jgi:signal transduction histidine kinase|nr:histidine kinase [Gemmatimonadaceae bacterium]MCC6430807.1 histidine kinase [Gemmatimonadaceae bacterium]